MSFIRQLTPVNFDLELARLSEEHDRGLRDPKTLRFSPEFRYLPLVSIPPLRQRLSAVLEALTAYQDESQISWKSASGLSSFIIDELIARVHEMMLQLEVLQARGDVKQMSHFAQKLYSFPRSLIDEANLVAKEWLSLKMMAPGTEERVKLKDYLIKLADADGQQVAIESSQMASVAAVGAGKLLVRQDAWVTEAQARRIYEHEVKGHLLMRRKSLGQLPPFRVGSVDADADEEGRAIWLEQEAGYLDHSRKKQLALRFLAAQAMRVNPTLRHVYQQLAELGVKEVLPRDILRLFRGGALGREVIYLPSFLRVKRAFAEEQQLTLFLSRGRLSCASAVRLQSLSVKMSRKPAGRNLTLNSQ